MSGSLRVAYGSSKELEKIAYYNFLNGQGNEIVMETCDFYIDNNNGVKNNNNNS